jgi:leucyl/phenylalanyl-tRNA--protein transferase
MFFVLKTLFFPDVETADKDGILAVGGDLSPERLILAYKSGIFPWFNDDEPILWWAPKKRMVLFFDDLIVSKSMKKIIKNNDFTITFNQNFKDVISNCKTVNRKGQDDTWISNDMIDAYCKLHDMGIAKSVEVWQNNELVGGLYGVDLGTIFCGESMFSKKSNASKVAFIWLANYLKSNDYILLDCQVYNDHLASLGCTEIDRVNFMRFINSEI